MSNRSLTGGGGIRVLDSRTRDAAIDQEDKVA